MPECTSTSNRKSHGRALLAFLAIIGLGMTAPVFAQSGPGGPPPSDPNAPGAGPGGAPAIPSGTKKEEANLFDQYSPYLDYGDFNSRDDEDADTLYFQYGRFFGVSLGVGYETATGNRGLLYNAALPRFDIKVHYWFDFQFAMAMGVWFASHSYEYNGQLDTAKLTGYYIDLKYYFDVRDASAALTFSNPYLLLGFGAISMTKNSSSSSFVATNDSTLSLSFGTGLEFPISHKKTYFLLDMRYWTQSFQDSDTDEFSNRVSDLNGGFFTLMGHLMFTW